MKLSIIIVSFNGKEFLRKCLQSIQQNVSKQIEYETIIVDNASEDESAQMVREEFPKALLIANKENGGFSKANNQGIKKSKGEYLFFLNPDTIVSKNSIETMIKFMENHNDAGTVTCKVELATGALDDAAHRGFPTPWNSLCYFLGITKLFPNSKLFSGYTLGWKDLTTTHEIDACAGAVMLTRRKAGEEIGWWDEDFFFYGEDIDFCYRLKEKGWKIYFLPEVSILHYKGVSGGIKKSSQGITTATEETKKRSTKARFDAMRIFYKKHYEKKYPYVITWGVYKAIDIKQLLSG